MNVTVEMYSIELEGNFVSCENKEDLLKHQEPYKPFTGIIKLAEWKQEGYQHIIEYDERSVLVTREQLLDLTLANIAFKVKSTHSPTVNISEQLAEMCNKPLNLVAGGGNTYNNKCEVHTPGQALSTYNDLMLLEDACTDSLQCSLNEGWRIIAACPQPDQRRPDYILGRFNPGAPGDSAKREYNL